MSVDTRHQPHAVGIPLIKELTALSRTRSLRDPSTSSVLKSPLMKAVPVTRKPDQHARKERSTELPEQTQTASNDVEVRRTKGEDSATGAGRGAVTEDSTRNSVKRNRKSKSTGDSYRNANLSRKIIMQLQQQQALAAHIQGQQGHHHHHHLPLGAYDDPNIVNYVKKTNNNNDYPESDQEGSEEEEYEEEQVQNVRPRSRSQSPLLCREFSKSRSPVMAKTKAFSFPDPGQQNFHYPNEDLDCNEEPKHGCGIPWHWSRLGQKQKGNMPSRRKCGDQVLSRSQSGSGRELATTMFPPECMSYSSAGNSDGEALPLLTEPEASISGEVNASSEVDSDKDARKFSRKGRSQMAADVLQARLREKVGWINSLSERKLHEEGQHKSLSYKYRPRTFKDMVGQNVVVQSLSNAVLRTRIVPVYLFQGPRGTGKSCAARVFAAALNCLSSEELRPCGLCRECVALNLGKSIDAREFDASRLSGVESVRLLLENILLPPTSARYRVSIIEDCHALSIEAWGIFLKAMEDIPANSIVILITACPEKLPRNIPARCQKFLFTKIKDADIVSRLQRLATKEKMEVEYEALELIASRSNGSLRDAETMLDQLGLLGQVVTLSTVQELVGLLPDDKLMELLDYALSGDTVSTVRNVRYLLESGVEPLALMSQLATVITDVLAGTSKPSTEQRKRRFFHKNTLNKEDMERLRQALKILSEAEKQVRASSDQVTWLTAAMLQFAPEKASIFPASSTASSDTQSLVAANDTSEKETIESPDTGGIKQQHWEHQEREQFESQVRDSAVFSKPEAMKSLSTVPEARIHPCQPTSVEGHESYTVDRKKLDDIWEKTLKNIRRKSLRHMLRSHSKLLSLRMQEVHATAELEFQHMKKKSKAEKSKKRISRAFQSTLGCPVEVQTMFGSGLFPEHDKKQQQQRLCVDPLHRKNARREGEMSPSQHSTHLHHHLSNTIGITEERLESAWAREAQNTTPSVAATMDAYQSENRVPLAVVMQQQGANMERYTQDSQDSLKFGRVRHLGPEVMIPSESNFEHPNLRLECRTKPTRRLLCCWKSSRSDEEKKVKQRRRRRRRGNFFLKLVPCARVCTC